MDPDMSTRISVTATDGHQLDAWRSDPHGAAKGGIVVLHAIYGLTNHMGDVCDIWAGQGFSAIAPALYDRIGKNTVHGYDQTDRGRESYAALTKDQILADVAGCAAALRPGPVAISGFCTGGSWAWVAAQELPFDASVNFYGSHVHQWLDYKPACPTIMHYGDADKVVVMEGVKAIQAANPEVTVYVYPGAGHAFFNPEQVNHNADAAALALSRSVEFLEGCFE
jgi:carboxymethylenebutenolidase